MSENMEENASKRVACDASKTLDCEICFETVGDPQKIQILQCNHRFCEPCLSDYISSTIKDGGLLSTALKCPGFQCFFELDDDLVLKMLNESELKLKYQHVIANCFVLVKPPQLKYSFSLAISYFQNNRLMKWCPSPGCDNAVCLEAAFRAELRESVRCSCGSWFCFDCHENSHDPVPCLMLKEWAAVKADDLEAQEWILLHTKPCPGCRISIEKQGGCMHMTCSKCRHEFCWVCMGNWGRSHNCGNNPIVPPVDGTKYLRRFATYNAKHETMKQAYDLDVVQYKHKMVPGSEIELDDQWIKIEFVASAIEILLQCRRTLMHSYIFSYFMTTMNNQMYIFEANLQYLERCTERLSEILEVNVTTHTILKRKEKIINGTDLCAKRRSDLLGHIKEGYEDNCWRKFPIPAADLVANQMQGEGDVAQDLLF